MDETTPTTTKVEPTRADYERERGKLRELTAASDLDNEKIRKSQLQRVGAERQAKALGMVFDPELAPPLYEGDRSLHEAHHAQHYVVAAIEKALGINQPAPESK